jgi:exopolysaccharide biosynthesis polyprenyl glycosylphosphotransferase
MRQKDTSDVLTSVLAIVVDALAVFGGIMLAAWVRFDSGWLEMIHARPPHLYQRYAVGAAVATLLFLFVFRAHELFVRPQTGSFPSKIPRIIRAVGTGIVLSTVLAFAVQNEADFSRLVIALALPAVSFLVLLERYILYRIEWNLARHSKARTRVLVLGTDSVADHIRRVLRKEPMLRSRVVGFLRVDLAEPDPAIRPEDIFGTLDDLEKLVTGGEVDQVILTNSSMGHEAIVRIILLCERNLIAFNMVPDLFRVMTSSMDVQSLEDIPLLGISRWPLDHFWNRVLKRTEDIIGSLIGVIVTAPVVAVAAILVKRSSPGPAFFRQTRCGEHGRGFTLYKLRTMRLDAEEQSGPIFAVAGDPRTTRVGAWLRRLNIDELPQLWNVLRGDMSLVGPRPERPHFVEKFKEDISHYMWRHVSKPGMTGWAQVNGLRGNTSIEERIKYDLYYLENWSLSLDFKIILRTLLAHENAY